MSKSIIKRKGIVKKLVSLLIILLLLTGCGVERRVIDDLAIIFGLGIDVDEEDNRVIKFTTSSPTQEDRAESPVIQTTVKAYGVDGFVRNWQYQRHKRLAIGKIQVMIFGENVMRDNFSTVLQEFREVPEMDINARVIFFDGQPQHVLALEVPEEQRVAIYIREVIERNVEAYVIPDVTLNTLTTDLLTRGKTGFLPYIEINEERDRIIVSGLALLDNDGKLATILNDLETMYFMLMTERRVGALLDTKVTVEEGKEATVKYQIRRNKVNFDTKIVDGKPEINIRINGQVELRELSAPDVEIINEEVMQRISDQLSKHLTVRLQRTIDMFQENNVDPVGLGELVRVRHKEYFKNNTWEDDYPDIKITNEVKVKLIRGNGFKRTH